MSPIHAADPWIAQSDELCEQAVQSFKEVWFDLGHRTAKPREALTIGRLWGDRNPSPTECGVIVASIQKLHAAVRGKGSGLTPEDIEMLGENLGVVIVDEAHRALAPSYGKVLRNLGVRFNLKHNDIALLGLTATPRRTGEAETAKLRRRFRNQIIGAPTLGADPVQSLRSQGILAHVQYESLEYDAKPIELTANASHAQYFENFEDIHTDVLRRLGEEHTRNRCVLDRIMDLDPSWPVLLFACSTQHAQAMASLLRRRGRSAGCVLASTRPATRRALVERFRNRELSVLCNYGVLTTGFDAPSVRCVVVARPTASAVLYEQMVGRGMRGPEFGGTERCLILDLHDNVQWRSKPVTVDYVSLENAMRQAE
jgi:superfamily II DNA or RNA helicase